MKKKNNGFTLIELLAVIIILAIIALIATPIIFNVIENAKLKSLENSTYGVIDAVRTEYAEGLLNSEDGLVELTGDVVDLTIAGEHPYTGTWEIDNSKDSNERGIKIQGVKFQSMKNYTCSNVDENGAITNKVSCEKDGVDEVQPTITAKQATVEVNKGTNKKIKNYFTAKFGKTSGIVTCEVENVSTLEVGDHIVKCTATGTNGKKAESSIKINVVDVPTSLKNKILGINGENVLKSEENQTWTTAWQTSDESGLYAQTVGTDKTYYFRGQPENNYIKFADKDFRIIRINEDGSIRIMLTSSIGRNTFNNEYKTYDKAYYTNSELKEVIDNWYATNIVGSDVDKTAKGKFCEAMKFKWSEGDKTGNATSVSIVNYVPSFSCTTDGNNKGIVEANVGLITYDEIVYAGGWYSTDLNYSYYLKGDSTWTMSPLGIAGYYASVSVCFPFGMGYVSTVGVNSSFGVRPVINLKADTLVTGTGTSSDPYIVK